MTDPVEGVTLVMLHVLEHGLRTKRACRFWCLASPSPAQPSPPTTFLECPRIRRSAARSSIIQTRLFLPLDPALPLVPGASRPQFQTDLKLYCTAPAPPCARHRPLTFLLRPCNGSDSRRIHIWLCDVRPSSRSSTPSLWRQGSDGSAPPNTFICTRKRAPCPESGP